MGYNPYTSRVSGLAEAFSKASTPAALTRRNALASAAGLLLSSCSSSRPTIEFTRVPPADKGGPDALDVIEGRVKGAKPGQLIVVFARSEVWWVEPRLGRV